MCRKQSEAAQIETAKEQILKRFNDINSSGAANEDLINLLDAIIQTALKSGHKFLFELLQNADDADDAVDTSTESKEIKIQFILVDEYLIVRHNGKLFDHKDVEQICRCANQEGGAKRSDRKKTGFKGIGFKSVFSISEEVTIVSNEYQFCFSKARSKDPKKLPWQIMPIWVETTQIPEKLRSEIRSKHVHFFIKLKNGENISKEFEYIRQHPEVMLFLRRITNIQLTEKGVTTDLAHQKKPIGSHCLHVLNINGKSPDQWLTTSLTVDIPEPMQKFLNSLDDKICPTRLKKAQSTTITFAAHMEKNVFSEREKSLLFTTFPTQETCELPFLINAEFLLSLDRSKLEQNKWNQFLMSEIGEQQFKWLSMLSSLPYEEMVYSITNLIGTPKHLKLLNEELSQAFSEGFIEGEKNIAWVPSHRNKEKLLTLKECVLDEIDFFTEFMVVDPIVTRLIHPRLAQPKKFTRRIEKFTDDQLLDKINSYLVHNKTSEFNRDLLVFLHGRIKKDPLRGKKLADTQCLLTATGTLVAPNNPAYLQMSSEQVIPPEVGIDPVARDVIKNKHVRDWLFSLGCKKAERIEIIRSQIFSWIADENRLKTELKPPRDIAIIKYLFSAFNAGEFTVDDYEILAGMMLRTKKGTLICARYTYLADVYQPAQPLEQMIDEPELYVDAIYLKDALSSDIPKWRSFFTKIGVKEKIEIHYQSQYSLPQAKLDLGSAVYNEYISHIKSSPKHPPTVTDKGWFKNFVIIDLIAYLKHQAYAALFWHLILTEWPKIKKYSAESAYANTRTTTAITPFLMYYTKIRAKKCIRASDGELHASFELYTPSFRDLALDEIKVPLIEGTMTDEQAEFFGFQTVLNCTDILRLLKSYKDNQEKQKPTVKAYALLYSHILRLQPNEKEKLRAQRNKICLLAEDNSLKPVTQLQYLLTYPDIKLLNASGLLKKLPDFPHEDMLQICQLFDIHTDVQPKLLHSGDITETGLKEFLLSRAPLIALFEAHRFSENPEKIFHTLTTKIMALTCVSVKELSLSLPGGKPHPLFAYIEHTTFYYVGRWNKSPTKNDVYDCIFNYLNIKPQREVLKLKDDSEIYGWLARYGLDKKVYVELLNQIKDLKHVKPSETIAPSVSLDDSTLTEGDGQEEDSLDGLPTAAGKLSLEDESGGNSAENIINAPIPKTPPHGSSSGTTDTPPSHKSTPTSGGKAPGNGSKSTTTSGSGGKSTAAPGSGGKSTVPGSDDKSSDDEGSFLHRGPSNRKKAELSLSDFDNDDNYDFKKVTKKVKLEQQTPKDNKPKGEHKTRQFTPKKTEAEKVAIGRWAEQYVYFGLLKHYVKKPAKYDIKETPNGFVATSNKAKKTVTVTWFNKAKEEYKPVDLQVVKQKDEKTQTKYIEVKGTESSSLTDFNISANEVQFMRDKGAEYQILRLRNAFKPVNQVEIDVIDNPAEEEKQQKVQLVENKYIFKYTKK